MFTFRLRWLGTVISDSGLVFHVGAVMPDGLATVTVDIRLASDADLPGIKAIADREKRALGFVHRAALTRSITRGEVLVGISRERIVGFCHLYRRRDGAVTVYHLAVDAAERRLGIGRRLIEHLCVWEQQAGATMIRLKCPADLDANDFYARMGFYRAGIDTRAQRHLILWEWSSSDTAP